MSSVASCVAVVGPANAGKTTLLHQLDEKLKRHLDSFLVLKGNPDGTGRYLYHAPELRDDAEFKQTVKGKWGYTTIDQICEWIRHGRRNLSLALLDFGGRHDTQTAAGNARMLDACSHYLVVSRASDFAGAEFWDGVCREHGLVRLGWMRSLPLGGAQPEVIEAGGDLQSTFQVGVTSGDPRNDAALAPLVEALRNLSRPADLTPYVNLRQAADWRIDQISDVAGQAGKIAELASRTGVVVLGGSAPIWAYLAGLRCALGSRADARIFFFDPRQPERLVEIPAQPSTRSGVVNGFPADLLSLRWHEQDGRWVLHLEITAVDKFLPPSAAQSLAGAPPPPVAPSRDVALWGAGPTWLYATYARWLISAGVQRLASWDGRSKSFVQIWM